MEEEKIPNLKVWTSMLERTKQTAQLIDAPKAHWKALNEIDAVSSHLSHINLSSGFLTRFDTNRAVQPQKNVGFRKVKDCTIYGAKTKQLTCAFLFTYAKSWFSFGAAHFIKYM